ncbi:hypothetical protein B0919_02280 [Hymenobacter sp. CRA2]|nr:hypothetical protein B0919_02280 [Hymenobacter sp. CRA2]
MRTSVVLTPAGQYHLGAREAPSGPVYLALENVRGTRDATILNVYLLLPDEGGTGAPRQLLVGGEALYGLRRASNLQGSNRAGLTLVFDITPKLGELQGPQLLQSKKIGVSIVPERPLPNAPDITVGRVSIFR